MGMRIMPKSNEPGTLVQDIPWVHADTLLAETGTSTVACTQVPVHTKERACRSVAGISQDVDKRPKESESMLDERVGRQSAASRAHPCSYAIRRFAGHASCANSHRSHLGVGRGRSKPVPLCVPIITLLMAPGPSSAVVNHPCQTLPAQSHQDCPV
jgi:hypothetical protein